MKINPLRVNLYRWKDMAGWNIKMENILKKKKIEAEKDEDKSLQHLI